MIKFPVFAENLTSMFGYDMVLLMHINAEGLEIALKLAGKWGYEKKRIPKDEAIIVSCCGCFHGCTLAAISTSSENEATHGFGPLLRDQLNVDFGDAIAFEKNFKGGDRLAGFLFELNQSVAGVIIPPYGYLKAVIDLCWKYNIFVIPDEEPIGETRSHIFDLGGGTHVVLFLPIEEAAYEVKAKMVRHLVQVMRRLRIFYDNIQGVAGGSNWIPTRCEVSVSHLEDKVKLKRGSVDKALFASLHKEE